MGCAWLQRLKGSVGRSRRRDWGPLVAGEGTEPEAFQRSTMMVRDPEFNTDPIEEAITAGVGELYPQGPRQPETAGFRVGVRLQR
jgi:hypothetical protein